MGHIRSTTCSEAAALGMDFIEHSFGFCDEVRLPNGDITRDPDAPPASRLIRALIAARVTMDGTPDTCDVALSQREVDVLHSAAREWYLSNVSASRRVDSAENAA